MIPIYAPTKENERRMREHHRQQIDVDVKRLILRQPITPQHAHGQPPGTDAPDIEDQPGQPMFLLVKTDSSHSKGASGSCSIFAGTKGSETDTGENITAWNRFADLDAGKWAVAAYVVNGWELIAGEC